MVICDETDITKNSPAMEGNKKKYVIVKNHVRELPTLESYIKKAVSSPEGLLPVSKVKNKKKRKSKTTENLVENASSPSENRIDPSDLEELRTVYNNCKAVIKKIESKYGHLLNLGSDDEPISNRKRRHEEPSDSSENEPCSCQLNKKIIFDDHGNETTQEVPLSEHICPHKHRRRSSDEKMDTESVAVEYDDNADDTLPEDLKELGDILKDTTIGVNYRNKVIKKYQSIKMEFMNELRFNRQSLVDQLKADPDEVLDFKGTNFESLQGYKI